MKKFDISNIIITKIRDIYAYTLSQGLEGDAESTSNVLLVRKVGCSEYDIDGKKYTCDKDNILFIPAGVKYSMLVKSAGECTVIEFDTLDVKDLAPCEFYVAGEKDILATVKNLFHYWKLKGPSYHSKCLSELYALVTSLSSVHAYTYSLASKYRMIHRSVKYIEANYRREDLYTPDLAKMSGMGETYYRSIFISVFSVPPTKYIQNYRIEKAKELIVNSTGSIEHIATSVGFANASYFCKVFKETTGLTPSEFAAKSRKLG